MTCDAVPCAAVTCAAVIVQVEAIVTGVINAALPVHCDVVPLAAARSIHSLCAVFGETYPDPVRVVSIGVPVAELVADPDNSKWAGYSVELCGGTHITHTSQVRCCRHLSPLATSFLR